MCVCIYVDSIGTSRKIIDDEVITNNKNDSIPVPLAASAPASPAIKQLVSEQARQPSKAVKQLASHTGGVRRAGQKGNTALCTLRKQNKQATDTISATTTATANKYVKIVQM